MNQAQMTKPIGGRVLLRLDEPKKKESNGVVVLEKDLAQEQEGTVVAIGAGRIGKTGKRVPMEIKVGDRVVIAKWAGTQIKMDNKTHLMIFYQDVVGVKG